MKILYYLFYGFMWILTLPPLKVLYVFSDMFYFLIYHVVGYRKKVVKKNLKNSFPEKTTEELKRIEQKFYHHFCDYIIETLKLMNISEKEIMKRVDLVNSDIVKEYYENDKSMFVYLGHYGNWEWLAPAWYAKHKDIANFKLYPAYYPLSSKNTDKFMYNLRANPVSFPTPQKQILRTIIKLNKSGQKGMFIFIADQSPMRSSVHQFVTFLNQDTATIVGPEKLAKQTGYPVFFFKTTKVKRGYYKCEFVKITDEPKNFADYEITAMYMKEMEKSIQEDPAYWLWTHRRWKFKKEEFNSDNLK